MRLLWCISCKLLEFLSSRVSYCTIFFSIPHFPTAAPPPIQGMSGDLSASVAPRGGAFVLANMTNPHLAPPSPVGGVVGHNIDRRISWDKYRHIQDNYGYLLKNYMYSE